MKDIQQALPWGRGETPAELDSFEKALEDGDVAAVEAGLDSGMSVEQPVWGSWTPLEVAVAEGHLELARLLLQRGARIGDAPAHTTDRALLQLLLEFGADPQSKLDLVLNGLSVETMRMLLEAGADPNRADEEGLLPLYHAASSAPLTALLIRYGADVNGYNPSHASQAIHFAACWGYTRVLRVLLQHGADPNAREQDDPTRPDDDTPLKYTASRGYLSATRVLLEYGADPDLPCHGRTPLMYAAIHGCSRTVEALLQSGADPTRRDSEGREAADYARDFVPDLLAAVRAREEVAHYRWRPRIRGERRLDLEFRSGGRRWYHDGHARIVELLSASSPRRRPPATGPS